MKPRKVPRLSRGSGWRTQVLIPKANRDTCAHDDCQAISVASSSTTLFVFFFFCSLLCPGWQILWSCEGGACTLTWTGPSLIKILPLSFYFVASLRFNFWHWTDSPSMSTTTTTAPPSLDSMCCLTVIPTLATDRLWIALHFSRHALEFHLDLWHVLCGRCTPPASCLLAPASRLHCSRNCCPETLIPERDSKTAGERDGRTAG